MNALARWAIIIGVVLAGAALVLFALPGLGRELLPASRAAMPAAVAIIGAAAVLLGTALLFREARAARRREQLLVEHGAALSAAYAELEAAKTLAEANTAQLRAIFSGMSDGVMMLDAALCLQQWNDRFPEISGVPRSLLHVGVPVTELLRAQAKAGEYGDVDPETEVRRRLALLADPRDVGVNERIRPNGQALEYRRSRLPDGGVVTLYTDITTRKLAEAARREARRLTEAAVDQKAQFVAMVSHEIRVPLNAVVGSLALLDQSGLTEQQHSFAGTARQAGETLLDLVNDILDLTMMDAGRLELRPGDVELRPLLEGVLGMFTVPAAAAGIALDLHIAPDLPPRLHADAGRLRQVLMNFVSNAVKFAHAGGVTLLADTAGHGTMLRLAVRDPGPRIPAAQAARLFQPFVRLDRTATPGTGLGLAICDRLARLMQGRTGLDPAGPDGNEFWIVLPLRAGGPAKAAASPKLPRPARRAFVLLVEDIGSNRMLIATLLRREGHHVDLADSGLAAVRMAARHPYDLVLMDLLMPGMDGREAARRIRALPGPSGTVPIVALTGNADARADCLAAGMNGVLAKPARPAELLDLLAGLARNHPPDPPAPPPVLLDEQRLAELQRSLPDGIFPQLVEACLEDIQSHAQDLRAALAAGTAAAIGSAAHALAGMAGSYGLAAYERRMRGIMRAAHAGDTGAAAALAAGMQAEFADSAEQLRRLLRVPAA